MQIGKAFTAVLQDPQWVTKVLIGGLISLVPVVGTLIVLGYMMKTAQNVAAGVELPMPAWQDFGDLIVQGLYGLLISIVYALPLIVMYVVFVIIISLVGVGVEAGSAEAASAAASLLGLGILIALPIFFVLFLISLVLGCAALGRYLQHGKLSDGLQVGQVIREVRSAPGPWFMVLLVAFLAGILASLGVIACFVGVIFTQFIAFVVNGHAIGQAMRQRGMIPQVTQPGYVPPQAF